MADLIRAVVAEEPDTPELASCLAAAYGDNPLFGWMFAHELTHTVLEGIFTGLIGAALPQRGVYKDPEILGAAIWLQARADVKADDSPMPGSCDLETSAGRRMAALGVLKARRPARPHVYLAAVGVLPEERRRGLATALLTPVLETSEATGLDAYLENSDPENTTFYEGLGFHNLGTLPMPLGCPPVVAMIRTAGTQPAN